MVDEGGAAEKAQNLGAIIPAAQAELQELSHRINKAFSLGISDIVGTNTAWHISQHLGAAPVRTDRIFDSKVASEAIRHSSRLLRQIDTYKDARYLWAHVSQLDPVQKDGLLPEDFFWALFWALVSEPPLNASRFKTERAFLGSAYEIARRSSCATIIELLSSKPLFSFVCRLLSPRIFSVRLLAVRCFSNLAFPACPELCFQDLGPRRDNGILSLI